MTAYRPTPLKPRLKIEEWGLQDEVRKACLDLKIQGGFALEVVYSIDRTTISKVRHCPFENVRSAEVDEDEKVDFLYYSKDWAINANISQPVKTFDPQQSVEHPVQILYVKPFSPGSYYYPKPDYIGSIDYIGAWTRKSGSTISTTSRTGPVSPSTLRTESQLQEERRRIRTDIERQLAGATNAGKFIVTYSDSPDRSPTSSRFPFPMPTNNTSFSPRRWWPRSWWGTACDLAHDVWRYGVGQTGWKQDRKEIFSSEVIEPYQMVRPPSLQCQVPNALQLGGRRGQRGSVIYGYSNLVRCRYYLYGAAGTPTVVANGGTAEGLFADVLMAPEEATELSEEIPKAKAEVADFLD